MAPDDARRADENATLTGTASPQAAADESGASGVIRLVGRYQLREVLGAGGMGVVYRAFDPELGRDVAIKVVNERGDAGAHARQLREAQAMARVRHPNIVPIFDVGPTEHSVFLAMPLLEEGTLKTWLASGKRSWGEILDRFSMAGRGLAAAHDAGLIHRDFKPDNVLLGRNGEVQVSDFGIARMGDEPSEQASTGDRDVEWDSLTRTGEILGTPAYMSPEQLRGTRCDERSDQFSFCVALWEALFAERPFAAGGAGGEAWVPRLLARMEGGPKPPKKRDSALAWLLPLLERGLQFDPQRRWGTMAELLAAIDRRRPRQWHWIGWGVALGLAAVLGTVAFVLRTGPPLRAGGIPPASPTYRLRRVTQQEGLKDVALSPDGLRLAILSGDSLIWRGLRPDEVDHVVLPHRVQSLGEWSPDSRHLIVFMGREPSSVRARVVDAETGDVNEVPFGWRMATFASREEIAATDVNLRTVYFYSAQAPYAQLRACPVPGEYTWLSSVFRVAEGTVALKRLGGNKTGSAIVLDHDCRVRASFQPTGRDVYSLASTDTNTLLALMPGDGVAEIVELSLDGVELSRRRVAGELHSVVGRRGGADYVLMQATETRILRQYPGKAVEVVHATPTRATFALSPNGREFAWVEFSSAPLRRGLLRVSPTASLGMRSRPLLADVTATSWAPSGSNIAAIVDSGESVHAVVLDRATGTSRDLPLKQLERFAAPLWLDERRVAGLNDAHTAYEWVDLQTGERGTLTNPKEGWVFDAARSPRDGTIALRRNTAIVGESLWVIGSDGRPRLLDSEHVSISEGTPFWNEAGELFVFHPTSGDFHRVALDTGRSTWVANVPPQEGFNTEDPPWFDGGALWLTQTRTSYDLAVIVAE